MIAICKFTVVQFREILCLAIIQTLKTRSTERKKTDNPREEWEDGTPPATTRFTAYRATPSID